MKHNIYPLICLLALTSCTTSADEYNRRNWRHWIDEDKDGQDTRQEVLMEESILPVIMHPMKQDKIIAGLWMDMYSGKFIIDPKLIDIDHFVPLGEAYTSGAYNWGKAKKRDYANDLSHDDHLIAVSSSLNRSKGKRDPSQWVPPNKAYWCEYATTWRNIKARWELDIDETEEDALKQLEMTCAD